MKHFLFTTSMIALCLLSSCISYQTFTAQPNVQVFEDITGTKEQLYVKANEWMVAKFNDAESVIQFSDKEEGTIIGKYLLGGSVVAATQYTAAADLRVYAIIDVRVKENKARISIDPQEWKSYNESTYPRYAFTPQKATEESDKLIQDFYTHMRGSNIDF